MSTPPDPVTHWDRDAAGWQRSDELLRAWLAEVTAQMLGAARITRGQRVLDIAAGTGGQTLEAARLTGPQGEVLATDISAAMIEATRALAHRVGLPQVRCLVADAQNLGLEGAGFDAAISRLGLMFCASPLSALREIRQALAPAGRLSAVVFSAPEANPCITVLMRTALRHAGRPATDPFAPGTLLSLGRPGLLGELLDQAGYQDIEVRPVRAPMRLARCEDYIEFVRTSASPIIEILSVLDEPARTCAWDDMTTQLRQFTTGDGWEGPNELLLCSATR